MIWQLLISILLSLTLVWLIFLAVLALTRPAEGTLREAIRVVPDTVRLVRRLAADRALGRGIRLRLWFLLAYLASPIDLVPDFIPVLGYADDAIVTSLVLRSVVRRAGAEQVRSFWPGTPQGLAALGRLCRIAELGERPVDQAVSVPPPATTAATDQRRSLRSGFVLEGITLGWNIVGIVVLAIAAIAVRSVALAGFGLDSLIEVGASTVVIWELAGTGEDRQRRALRLIGLAFIGLAIYLGIQSTYVLVTGFRPDHSPGGIVWTALTAIVMFSLAAGKARVGKALNNPVLQTEGRVTAVDGLLATAVLTGLVLNAAYGWWWADPLAGYVILFYGLKEGLAALRH